MGWHGPVLGWQSLMTGSQFSAANSSCCLKYSNPAKMSEVEDAALHTLKVPRAVWYVLITSSWLAAQLFPVGFYFTSLWTCVSCAFKHLTPVMYCSAVILELCLFLVIHCGISAAHWTWALQVVAGFEAMCFWRLVCVYQGNFLDQQEISGCCCLL